MMKRFKLNYRALHVLTKAEPKFLKAITSNCDNELVNSISECNLNVLKGTVCLTGCNKRNLRKHMAVLRKVADKRVPTSSNKKLILGQGGLLMPILGAVRLAISSLIFSSRS